MTPPSRQQALTDSRVPLDANEPCECPRSEDWAADAHVWCAWYLQATSDALFTASFICT